jgi:hypothetical protein
LLLLVPFLTVPVVTVLLVVLVLLLICCWGSWSGVERRETSAAKRDIEG